MRRPRYTGALDAAVVHERGVVALVAILVMLICTDVYKRLTGGAFPDGPVTFGASVVMVGYALFNLRFLLRAAFAAPELALLLVLVLLSALWSLDPVLTLERTFQLYATSATAMLLASMLSVRSLMIALASIAGLLMVASLVAIMLVPEARGVDPWPNAWRGVFPHKNGLGASAALSLILIAAAISITTGGVRRAFVLLGVLSLVLLVASQSRTSQVIAVFCVGAVVVAAISRNHLRIWMIGFLATFVIGFGMVIVVLFSGLADPWLEAIGRQPTLSNRIPLWEVVWPDVIKQIWIGYGYETYWDPEADRVARIARIPLLGFTPFYSHNGLIELLLNVGLPGVPLVAIALLRAMTGAYVALRVKEVRVAGASALVLLVAFLLSNFMESTLLNSDSFGWFVFMAVATKLSLLLKVRSRRWLRGSASADRRTPRRVVRRGWVARA